MTDRSATQKGLLPYVLHMVRDEGVGSLYKGFVPNFARIGRCGRARRLQAYPDSVRVLRWCVAMTTLSAVSTVIKSSMCGLSQQVSTCAAQFQCDAVALIREAEDGALNLS